MKQQWDVDEIVAQFTLLPPELSFLGSSDPHNHLGKALLLNFFQHEGRFPESAVEIPLPIIEYVAQQLNLPADVIAAYQWDGRTIKRHRRQIREFLGFHPATVSEQRALRTWLIEEVLPHEHRPVYLEEQVYQRLRQMHIEPPTQDRLQRLIISSLHRYEQSFFAVTSARLSEPIKRNLRQLIYAKAELTTDLDLSERDDDPSRYPLHDLKTGPGQPNVANIKKTAERLKILQQVGLSDDLFAEIPLRFLRQYRQQVAVESISHLQRRQDAPQTYALLAAFCWVRQREITDQLVDLFVRILNDIRLRAKQKVERELLADFIRVAGKQQLLYRLADAMWENPDGIIREVLYPLIGEERLQALVQEAKTRGSYQRSVQTRVSASYTHHYRQILPSLLEVLVFRSNNDQYEALAVVAAYLQDKDPFYPEDQAVPMEDVIQKQWQNWIYQRDQAGRRRIRRVRYELCVLQSLRDKLRCKEIWVVGADRYRNPDEDVPADFGDKRTEYYASLALPLDANQFVEQVKHQLDQALQLLNDTLPTNPTVTILSRADGWIRVTPLPKQEEPANLRYLKQTIRQRWWMTSLLDILKEVDLRVAFTDSFQSLTGQERLPRAELQKRLLLCLYGLGTNTGLTSVSMGNHGVSYANLQYVRRRFVARDALRQAISRVIDATLAVRQPAIWGEATTWCASDSKQFAAWNQNLLTQWHKRYHKAGVMVYWHVANQALCIYSQLKAPSSSEVASMIEGVLHHCTAMQVDRNYVDSHGQSEIAFAFCHLLGFQLMPRFKNLHERKLALPDGTSADRYPHLGPVLRQPIDWDLIARQYDEMIKYATALRLDTADAEAILKRFTRSNLQHPTYKALSELGRAIKTIFLCLYLTHEEVRREIQEGLNVVESWNSANGFIFYGKRGEVSSNDADAQEIAILSMHLLQSCLVYVNTLMAQEVLAEPAWQQRMTEADWRGLTPLFYTHVNPYGVFDLDMDERIPLVGPATTAA
ncbi:Tn3 family transposase [bacterium]|nr:Tn3 family transposase [bacterium]